MSKLLLIELVLALNLQAGEIRGFIVDPNHLNYDAQRPDAAIVENFPGIRLEDLLLQNPQYAFDLYRLNGRDLIAYYNPILPADQVILTTLATPWVPKDEPNFERFVQPPTVPPEEPPSGCEAIHTCPLPPCMYNCGSIVPSLCEHDCHPEPPVCIRDCEGPPGHEVPEPGTAMLVVGGLTIFFLLFLVNRLHR